MAAETLTNALMTVGPTHGLAGNLKVWHRKYEIAANVEDGDIFELGYIPGRIMVCGSALACDDMDTGTEALDMDVGWAANGDGSTTYTDPETGVTYTNAAASAVVAGLHNAGVLTGDGLAESHTGNLRVQFYTEPLYFSAKTKIQIEANVAAATFAAGGAGVYIFYYAL
jgi:hypothetical protein